MNDLLIDTHAHLTDPRLRGDVTGVLERCVPAGVGHVITVGTDLGDSRLAVRLAEEHGNVSAVAGIHPHEAAKVGVGDYGELRELLRCRSVVGMGELGLDYHYDFSDRASQHAVFKAQLELAGEFDLPLVMHCREAVADATAVLHDRGFDGRRVVFHCFTGTADEARLLADHGWRISFTGVVTFPKSTELQGIAQDYPAEHLMLETDAPYLSPVPMRKVRPNEPGLLRHTAEFMARLRGEPLDELAALTTKNAREFFNIIT